MVFFAAILMFPGPMFVVAANADADGKEAAGRRFDRHLDRMAEIFGLNDAQKEQISAIMKAEWYKNSTLRQQIAEDHKQLSQASPADIFDDEAIQAIGNDLAKTEAQLIVSLAKVRNQIRALLTP